MFFHSSASSRTPSSSAEKPEHRRVGVGLVEVAVGGGALGHDEADEPGHGRPRPAPAGRSPRGRGWPRARRRGRAGMPPAAARGRRGCDQLGVGGHEGQPVDGAAARGEQVHGATAEGLDDAPDVVGMVARTRLGGAVALRAASDPARVVGDDRPVGEEPGQRREPLGRHRAPDDHEHRTVRCGGGQVAVHVVGDGRRPGRRGAGLVARGQAWSSYRVRPRSVPQLIGSGAWRTPPKLGRCRIPPPAGRPSGRCSSRCSSRSASRSSTSAASSTPRSRTGTAAASAPTAGS